VPITLSIVAGLRLEWHRTFVRLTGHGEEITIEREPPVLLAAIRRIAAGRSTYQALTNRVLAAAGIRGLCALHDRLGDLFARGWLAHRVCHDGAPIISVIPLSAEYRLDVEPIGNRACVLSRFAFLRRRDSELALESPTAHARIILHDRRAMALLWRISTCGRLFDERLNGGLPAHVVRSLMDALWNAGVLTSFNMTDGVPQDETSPLLHWEFHDLLFHSRSRLGRHRERYGATFHLEGRVGAPPVIRDRTRGKRILLARPDINRLTRTDWTLTRTLETRRSQRRHGEVPIPGRHLGEFLYRTSRIQSVTDGGRFGTSRRVYPSGGSAHALDLYLAIRQCSGIDPGLYRYCPAHHDLQLVARMNRDVRDLLDDAARAARAGLPQVLIIIAARFLRMSWKYSSMSYATILKDVGALVQTMYLVATTMNLAVCAIGGGNSDLFARAAGMEYYSEGSVGELIIGRPPQITG
jgi:SagB-type dehydrogenase family enzyme